MNPVINTCVKIRRIIPTTIRDSKGNLMPRPIFVALAAFVLSGAVALGQTKVEIFGGYSFERVAPCGSSGGGCNFENNTGPITSNFNRWEAAVTGYLTRSLGMTADFAGHYAKADLAFGNGSVSSSSYTYLFGPTYTAHLRQISPFFHGLLRACRGAPL